MYAPEYCVRYQLETFILSKRKTDEPRWLTAMPARCSLLSFLSFPTKNRGVFYKETVKSQVSFSNLKSQRGSALCSYPVTILQSPVITLSGLSSALTSLQQPFANHFMMIFTSAIPLSHTHAFPCHVFSPDHEAEGLSLKPGPSLARTAYGRQHS